MLHGGLVVFDHLPPCLNANVVQAFFLAIDWISRNDNLVTQVCARRSIYGAAFVLAWFEARIWHAKHGIKVVFNCFHLQDCCNRPEAAHAEYEKVGASQCKCHVAVEEQANGAFYSLSHLEADFG